jgi:hypothetical protein
MLYFLINLPHHSPIIYPKFSNIPNNHNACSYFVTTADVYDIA